MDSIASLVSPWVVGMVFLAAMLIATELGYRGGRRRAKSIGQDKASGSELGAIQGGVMMLLALLVAFTYSYAATRLDRREQFVLDEANTLGAAHVRAGMLPEPSRGRMRGLLGEYLDSRLLADHVVADAERLKEAVEQSERIQARLWPEMERIIDGRAPSAAEGPVLDALVEVEKMHRRRLAAGRDRVPDVIVGTLLVVSAIGMGLAGFSGGLAGRRNLFFTTTLAVLVSIVVTLIMDLDASRQGLIRVRQAPLEELRSAWRSGGVPTRP